MTLLQVNNFIKSLYWGTNYKHLEITSQFRHKVKEGIKCVKREYQKLWRGGKLLNPKKEKQLYRLEEKLWNLL